jgi:hypothetical protein
VRQRVVRLLAELGEYSVQDEENVYELVGGVLIGLRPTLAGDAIYVMKIKTSERLRGQGAASEALAWLCSLADEHSVTLCLEVEPFDFGGLSEAELLGWYKRFGFTGNAREMIREPAEENR